jgi:hypothetical protein
MSLTNGIHASAGHLHAESHGEMDHLRSENEELRSLVLELEHALQQNTSGDSDWDARSREYESLLEEKSDLIRELYRKVQALEQALAAHKPEPADHGEKKASGPVPREEELMLLSEDLERERRQLREDEESLMEQMREMEVQMARERAEMARQRNELQRLQNDLRHELEMSARDATLRERLAPLQRRHQEVIARQGQAPSSARPAAQQAAPKQAEAPPKPSGILRRLFGS